MKSVEALDAYREEGKGSTKTKQENVFMILVKCKKWRAKYEP